MNQLTPKDNPTILLQQMHRWRMAFFGMVILLAGAVIGASLSLLVLGPKIPEPPESMRFFPPGTLDEIAQKLNLTGEQKGKIEGFMQKHMEELRRIREEEMLPKIIAEFEKMKKDIDSVLTEEQIKLWQEEMEHMQRWRGPDGGPDGRGGRPNGIRGGRPGGGPRDSENWDRDRQRFRSGQDGPGFRREPGSMDRRGFNPDFRRPPWQEPNSPNSPNEPNLPEGS